MTEVFLDTDVLLDVFLERQPFAEHASKVMHLAETNKIKTFASPLSFANIFYLLRKKTGNKQAVKMLTQLEKITSVLEMNEKNLRQSLSSSFSDFEDALQYYCCRQNNQIAFLLTRNVNDFLPYSHITVCTPKDFINHYYRK